MRNGNPSSFFSRKSHSLSLKAVWLQTAGRDHSARQTLQNCSSDNTAMMTLMKMVTSMMMVILEDDNLDGNSMEIYTLCVYNKVLNNNNNFDVVSEKFTLLTSRACLTVRFNFGKQNPKSFAVVSTPKNLQYHLKVFE